MSQFYTKEQIDAQGAYIASTFLQKMDAEIPFNFIREKFVGTYPSEEALPSGMEIFGPEPGMYAYVDSGPDSKTEIYLLDMDTVTFVKSNVNPEDVNGPSIEEAEDISSFKSAFSTSFGFDPAAGNKR